MAHLSKDNEAVSERKKTAEQLAKLILYARMATESEQEMGHKIIAKLFDLPARDMGGGLRIVCPVPSWMTVEERDLIVMAIKKFIARDLGDGQ